MIATEVGTTRALAAFLARLTFDDLPAEVVDRTKLLCLDWIASTLAGKDATPVCILAQFAAEMGPPDGPSEILSSRRRTSPYFAALVNAASSHVVEQDDVHNGSVFHPGTVVFPPVLAVAQGPHLGTARVQRPSGRDFLTAVVAGYEAGIRVGSFLGRSHYRVFHTTGTAGTLAAAAAVARLLNAKEEEMLHALGSAGTQASGLWEFLRDGAHSKQLHTAMASANGLLAAYGAMRGLTGATRILEGVQGMAAGMSTDANPEELTTDLGTRWAILDTSFKYHAACRHTHPAADALLKAMTENHLSIDSIARVRARVHAAAIDVLGPVVDPRTVHQAKFSMAFVLATIALHGQASVTEFSDASLHDETIRSFMSRVEMVLDTEVDAAYPARWIGLVEVETTDGRCIVSRVDTPKGDPGNTLTPGDVEDKVRRLAAYRNAASPDEVQNLIEWTQSLERLPEIGALLT